MSINDYSVKSSPCITISLLISEIGYFLLFNYLNNSCVPNTIESVS